MSDRASRFDGERLQNGELAPEVTNTEQVDSASQAQTVADEAVHRSLSVLGSGDSEKLSSSLFASDTQDLVDHMKQMDTSGIIDLTAFRGEPNHDDNVDLYGRASKLDGLRGDGT